MSGYPVLVGRYAPGQATRAICEGCRRECDWDPSEGDPYDLCVKCEACGEQVVFKYAEADRCGGCGRLGFYEKVLGYCCSRRCQLQSEYANELAARKAGAA